MFAFYNKIVISWEKKLGQLWYASYNGEVRIWYQFNWYPFPLANRYFVYAENVNKYTHKTNSDSIRYTFYDFARVIKSLTAFRSFFLFFFFHFTCIFSILANNIQDAVKRGTNIWKSSLKLTDQVMFHAWCYVVSLFNLIRDFITTLKSNHNPRSG